MAELREEAARLLLCGVEVPLEDWCAMAPVERHVMARARLELVGWRPEAGAGAGAGWVEEAAGGDPHLLAALREEA